MGESSESVLVVKPKLSWETAEGGPRGVHMRRGTREEGCCLPALRSMNPKEGGHWGYNAAEDIVMALVGE